MPRRPRLLATSDLHVSHTGNREVVEQIRPTTDGDWLILAGDVADRFADVEWTLRLLRDRFARVIWAPGNHELWTLPRDEVQLRGDDRYRALVEMCRGIDVLTPEDPYPIWPGADGDLLLAPLFLLYDYSWRPVGLSRPEAVRYAESLGVVCTDEFVLHPDPFPTREAWAAERLRLTRARLDSALADATNTATNTGTDLRTVLISHWPLHRSATAILRWPHFAMWCGTEETSDWHVRYRAACAVYGHLHLPMTLAVDGVRFEEVSLGYPREWGTRRQQPPSPLRRIDPPERRTPMDVHFLKAVGRGRRKATLNRLGPGSGLATSKARLRRMLG